jgi:hypothetical protein
MKETIKMRKTIYFIFSFLLASSFLNAQGGQDMIELPGVGNRTIEPAYRMNENPAILDTVIASQIINYPLLAVQIPTKLEVEPILPATIKTESQLDQLYNTYVKLGIGSELMPLGEIYFDSKRSRKFLYGAHAKHLSSFGNFSSYLPARFDRTQVGLYGKLNETKYSLNSELYYTNQGFHYYGYPLPEGLTTDSIDRTRIAQRYQDFGGRIAYHFHPKDSSKFNYYTTLGYNRFGSKAPSDSLDDWRVKENHFDFTAGLKYRSGKEVYRLDLRVNHNGYAYGSPGDTLATNTLSPLPFLQTGVDTAILRSNTIVGLSPTISTYLQNNRFRAQIGVDMVVDVDTKAKVHVYPLAELKYSLFNDIFIPYVGVRGGLNQLSFKSLAAQNEFILPNLHMRNESRVIDLYGGIKGTLSKRINFNLGASFARVRDKAFFISDDQFSLRNKFDLVYDTLSLTTLEGSIAYQVREKIKIDAIGKFYSYELNHLRYAWNAPVWEATLRGGYNLFDKFLVNLDFHVEGGRKAQFYSAAQIEFGGEQTGNPLNVWVTVPSVKTPGFIADVNLGLEYRYNKRISAFLQLNNLASQRYMRWYNYPVQIFQIMGGVTARF